MVGLSKYLFLLLSDVENSVGVNLLGRVKISLQYILCEKKSRHFIKTEMYNLNFLHHLSFHADLFS